MLPNTTVFDAVRAGRVVIAASTSLRGHRIRPFDLMDTIGRIRDAARQAGRTGSH